MNCRHVVSQIGALLHCLPFQTRAVETNSTEPAVISAVSLIKTSPNSVSAHAGFVRTYPCHPWFLLGVVLLVSQVASGTVPCRIDVVEQGSGWPVPLVELRTTHNVRFVSDNAGVIAFDLPATTTTRYCIVSIWTIVV